MPYTKQTLVAVEDLYETPYERLTLEKHSVKDRKHTYILSYYKSFVMVVIYVEGKGFLVFNKYAQGPQKEVLGFAGGFIEINEDPLAAAKRELLEETGLVADTCVLLGSCLDNVAKSRIPYYIAFARIKEDSLVVNKNPDSTEGGMSPEYLSEDDLFTIHTYTRMVGAVTISALAYLQAYLKDNPL